MNTKLKVCKISTFYVKLFSRIFFFVKLIWRKNLVYFFYFLNPLWRRGGNHQIKADFGSCLWDNFAICSDLTCTGANERTHVFHFEFGLKTLAAFVKGNIWNSITSISLQAAYLKKTDNVHLRSHFGIVLHVQVFCQVKSSVDNF